MSEHTAEPAAVKRLERARDDRMLAGVCGGLARYFGIHPAFYRVAFVVLTLISGAGILIYAAAALAMPGEGEQESPAAEAWRERSDRPWPLIGLGLVAVAGIVLLARLRLWPDGGPGWILLLAVGAAILWHTSRQRQIPGAATPAGAESRDARQAESGATPTPKTPVGAMAAASPRPDHGSMGHENLRDRFGGRPEANAAAREQPSNREDHQGGTRMTALSATDVAAVDIPAAEAAASQLLSATRVARRYGSGETAVEALRGVSLDIQPGRLTAIMGPSGSGKSTLMHILAGLDMPTEGSVVVDGIDITKLSEKKLTLVRRQKIGFVFQFFNLLPMLTAEENVLLPLDLAGVKPDREWIQDLLDTTGVADRRTHRPSELSGGQQQRVAIARALVSRPKILFADEPTGNLDSSTSKDVLALIRRSVDELGQTTLMVTHDPRAAAMADRILFLADGRIVQDRTESTAAEVLAAMQEVTKG